jgi:hypothetical protein
LSAGAHDAVGARPEVAGEDQAAIRTNIADAQNNSWGQIFIFDIDTCLYEYGVRQTLLLFCWLLNMVASLLSESRGYIFPGRSIMS